MCPPSMRSTEEKVCRYTRLDYYMGRVLTMARRRRLGDMPDAVRAAAFFAGDDLYYANGFDFTIYTKFPLTPGTLRD